MHQEMNLIFHADIVLEAMEHWMNSSDGGGVIGVAVIRNWSCLACSSLNGTSLRGALECSRKSTKGSLYSEHWSLIRKLKRN